MKLITISKGTLELAKVQLNKPYLTIGRSPVCDVVLRAPGIKAIHYVLEWSGTGEFSSEIEHEGSWVLFDTSKQGTDAEDEGLLLDTDSTDIAGLKFRLVTDRLETKSKIGGRIASQLKNAEVKDFIGMNSQIEAVHIRSVSGAIESVNYVSPAKLSSSTLSVFPRIPQFRLRGILRSSPQIDLHQMPGATVYSRGQKCLVSNNLLSISHKEIYCVKWDEQEFFVRMVPGIILPVMPHNFLGDTLTKKLYLAGLATGILLFLLLSAFSQAMQDEVIPNTKRLVQIEVAEPVPTPKVVEPPAPPPPPPPPPPAKVEAPPKKLVDAPAPAGPANLPKKAPVKSVSRDTKPKISASPVKAPPSASRNPAPPAPPSAAQVEAAQAHAAQAKVAQSLSFLNSPTAKGPKTGQINTPNVASGATVPSSLREQAKLSTKFTNQTLTNADNGPIETKGSRTFKGDRIAGMGNSPEGTGQVYGKVNLKGGGGGGGGTGSALEAEMGGGGGGLTLSGIGTGNGSEIEKAIQRNIRKFQYCYEKALLSDPNLGGTVVMSWEIMTSGRSQNIKVKSTQIRQNDFLSCIKNELGKIAFPAPTGGSIELERPFSFSSSKL